jgi:hypothetical protein
MANFSVRQLALIVIRYRGILVALLIATSVTLWLDGSHRGVPVLIASHDVAAGTSISPTDFTSVYLDGGDSSLYVSEFIEDSTQTLGVALSAGQPLMVSNLSSYAVRTDQIVVQVPLEAGNPGSFSRGSLVHVWALGDEYVSLVCSDARVLETYSLNGSAWVTLSVARLDENAVMQAGSVRLAVL